MTLSQSLKFHVGQLPPSEYSASALRSLLYAKIFLAPTVKISLKKSEV
jgi:hypothetical protein